MRIGFGMGESLVTMAEQNPTLNFVGVEVYEPGVGHVALSIKAKQLNNLKVVLGDAWEFLHTIPNQSVARCNIFFPDPWPKKRHHKRRLMNQQWVALIGQKLNENGAIHLVTDWQDYADYANEVLSEFSYFKDAPRLLTEFKRPKTKYEQRGLRLGHQIHDMVFQKSIEGVDSSAQSI